MPKKETRELALKTSEGSFLKIHKILAVLAVSFFVIWILIGLFLLTVITQTFKSGALTSFFKNQPVQQPQVPQAPAEAELPGIGRVNVQCVTQALSVESIQKIVEKGNTSALTEEEKSSLEPCVIEKANTDQTKP